jgi:hypothetical protein
VEALRVEAFGARARVEQPLVQILVVVANIRMRTLKTEVEKGSARTVIGCGSVGPKGRVNSLLF